jgi:hypothetical protein
MAAGIRCQTCGFDCKIPGCLRVSLSFLSDGIFLNSPGDDAPPLLAGSHSRGANIFRIHFLHFLGLALALPHCPADDGEA